MIKSVYKKKHTTTGIIYVLVNTKERWIEYEVEQVSQKGNLSITVLIHENIKLTLKEHVEVFNINISEDFDSFNYIIYHQQCKDQITFMLIPKVLLLNKQEWTIL